MIMRVTDYVWEYGNCRDYSHVEYTEAWEVDCHAIGTAGNLEMSVAGTLCRDDTGELSLWICGVEVPIA